MQEQREKDHQRGMQKIEISLPSTLGDVSQRGYRVSDRDNELGSRECRGEAGKQSWKKKLAKRRAARSIVSQIGPASLNVNTGRVADHDQAERRQGADPVISGAVDRCPSDSVAGSDPGLERRRTYVLGPVVLDLGGRFPLLSIPYNGRKNM
jgi:hypothetical protein